MQQFFLCLGNTYPGAVFHAISCGADKGPMDAVGGYCSRSEGEVTAGMALTILLYSLSGAASLVVIYALWFVLLPMQFRMLRDQFRRSRDRKKSN